MADAPATPQLYGITLFVHRLERCLEFYRDVLGLPVHKQGSFGAEFFDHHPHLTVAPANHPNAAAMVGRETGLTIFIPQLLHRAGDFHARGVSFVQEPTKMGFGIMAMVKDPDGNVLALWDPEVPDDDEQPPEMVV
ncbi:MAG: VOC family protein [Gemmatimonadales bacterium]|nr:VOC family protein [Gemmatimonadales bacterium]